MMAKTYSDDLIRELCVITTRNEAGQHFTKWSSHYDEMEELGLIDIHRPIHEPSGVAYSQECWSLEVADAGQELVDAHPELHPGASAAEQAQLQNLDVASMMRWLNAKGIEPDQDWDAGSTTWTFDDGSKIVIEGNDVTVQTPSTRNE
jgi:hypothetical protein